jgi:NADH-quinone oxidoreductase subunit G
MPKLTINGVEVTVEAGTTVLQACEQLDIEIPRFCYHDRLQIAGNCRMCLVEMERSPKPIASCAMPVADGMVIRTNTAKVRKARQGVMEFLLINHPLDCPICDQGGECDLQDQTMAYGFDKSRYAEFKRAVPDKDLGPLIETHMTRCIHCTRCVRFITEIAGVEELGTIHRGEHMEISTYVEKAISSELSGNIIDLCPVGALNSKPYAYTARSWELTHTETIDVHDAVGSNVRVDARGREVMRVLPRLHEDVNEEWISDKSRFAYDGLRRSRLDQPYVRKDGKLVPASWNDALRTVADRMAGAGGAGIAAIAGDLADTESMFALKQLLASLGSTNVEVRQDGAKVDARARAGYLFNTSIAGIEQADAVLLIGTNPRWEAALVNARLRKRFLRGGFAAYSIGPRLDLTFPVENLGAGTETLAAIMNGTHPAVPRLKAAKRPMVIVGQGALARPDGAAILHAARRIAEEWDAVQGDWNGFNVLHTAASRVGGLDVGFVPAAGDVTSILEGARSGKINVVYLLGADEIDMNRLGNAFVVYQGHHGDAGAHRADVILPGAAYTEKFATYVNLEGRPQRTKRAAFPPGEAREDWSIIRALSERVGAKLPYDTLEQLREHMVAAHPHLGRIDLLQRAAWAPFGAEGTFDAAPFRLPIDDFYMTNVICRASETMAACSELFIGQPAGATGTHG